MIKSVTPAEVQRVCELANHAALLAITRPHLIGKKADLDFKILLLPHCAIVTRIPTKANPGIVPGKLPNELRVWRSKEIVLDVSWSTLPAIEMRIEQYSAGDWETALLDEKLHSAEPERGRELPN